MGKTRLPTVTKDELFSLEDSLPQASFVAASNARYVSVKQGVDVTANQDEISDHETFQMEFDPSSKRWYMRTMQDNTSPCRPVVEFKRMKSKDQKTPSSTSSGIVMGPFLLKQIMVNTLEQKSQGTFMPIAMISVKIAASITSILSIVL